MKITSSQLDNVSEIKNISAVSTYGIGLLTYIVSCFIELLGISNSMYSDKIERAKNDAVNDLIGKATSLKAAGIMNFRVQVTGKTVLVYGTAYKTAEAGISDELPEL